MELRIWILYRKFCIFIGLVIGFPSVLISQDLAAYTDFRGHFFIFDKGRHHQVEDLEVQSFSVGGEQVLYINSQGNLKLYQNGKVELLERVGVSEYQATDHLAVYSIYQKLKVIEDGVPVTLSHRCPKYSVQDSLIVFYDTNLESLRIYYNRNIEDIESGLVGLPVRDLQSGDNIVAYISTRDKEFKIYYRGENRSVLQGIDKVSYKAGKDIVAYIDPADNSFNAFYKGEMFRLEDFTPESFKLGDGFVAYVDDMGNFKVFSANGIQEISSFRPEAYLCEDQLMVFTEYGYFKVYSRGKVMELEPYTPKNFKMDWNTLVYIDNTNRIWQYSHGEKQYMLNELIDDFEIYRDLVMLNLKMDRNLIYYHGEFIEGQSY